MKTNIKNTVNKVALIVGLSACIAVPGYATTAIPSAPSFVDVDKGTPPTQAVVTPDQYKTLASVIEMQQQAITQLRTGFNQDQEKAIEVLVAKTLIQNPQILVEAVQSLKAQQEQMQNQQAIQAVQKNAKALALDSTSPTVGGDKAPVTVVEFFDYQCSFCHQAAPVVEQLMKQDPNVRFVFKELPIFGGASKYAAEMSLAAYQQGKFEAFHHALFESDLMEGRLTNPAVDQMAKQVGVNLQTAATYIQSQAVSDELNQNKSLAQALGINGTPDFVVMPTAQTPDITKTSFLLGAVSADELTQAIKKAGQSE